MRAAGGVVDGPGEGLGEVIGGGEVAAFGVAARRGPAAGGGDAAGSVDPAQAPGQPADKAGQSVTMAFADPGGGQPFGPGAVIQHMADLMDNVLARAAITIQVFDKPDIPEGKDQRSGCLVEEGHGTLRQALAVEADRREPAGHPGCGLAG